MNSNSNAMYALNQGKYAWNAYIREHGKPETIYGQIGHPNGRPLDLSGVDLSGIKTHPHRTLTFVNCNLNRANMQNAYIPSVTIDHCSMRETNAQGINLDNAKITALEASLADFSYAYMRGINVSRSNFNYATMTHINASPLFWGDGAHQRTNFGTSTFYSTDLKGADLKYTNLYDTNLNGADITDADISQASLPRHQHKHPNNIDKAIINPNVPHILHLPNLSLQPDLLPDSLKNVGEKLQLTSLFDTAKMATTPLDIANLENGGTTTTICSFGCKHLATACA